MDYASHLRRDVPQSEALPGQVPNSAGGFSFAVDKWKRMERFLILGSDGGSYYATEQKLTLESAKAVENCIADDGPRAVRMIVEVSRDGRAPKNDPALVALAIALKKGDLGTRHAAADALTEVARIGTHMFHLAEYVKALGGWGRLTTAAFARWYTQMPVDKLALQAIKYQSRDGWAHGDLLRKCHPKTTEGQTARRAIFNWMVNGWESVGEEPHPDESLVKIWAFEKAKTARGAELRKLIEKYGLPHECVPNEAKGDPKVWAAMLPSMGITAIIRNLGKMTSVGLLAPMSAETKFVASRLRDVDMLRKGRVHPMSLLVAQRIYAQGHGDKGSLRWGANSKIIDALDEAFYLAFKAVEPTGKRHLLALDVSGSMESSQIAGMNLSAREGSAAMALVTMNVEENTELVAFTMGPHRSLWGANSSGISPLPISARSRLDDATGYVSRLNAGGTDCALPMLHALQKKIPVDVFVIYTDNETWAGDIHPKVALETYRQRMGIGAKLVVVGMVANKFSIADQDDAGMLDVVGFDTNTPAVLADFARN
jgi:60 kDa SS-A/Ro ribonucleoprotein